MKTLWIFVIVSLLTLSTSRAQTERGRWLIGASLSSLAYQKQASGYRSIAMSLTPSAGYFVANGLVLGAGLPASFSGVKYGDSFLNYYNLRLNGTSIGLAPFVRYYIGHSKLQPFLGVAYSYSHAVNKFKSDTGGGAETKSSGHTTALTPTIGLAYFFTHTLGLALNINYNVTHSESNTVQQSPYTPSFGTTNSDTRSLTVGIGLQIFVGKQ